MPGISAQPARTVRPSPLRSLLFVAALLAGPDLSAVGFFPANGATNVCPDTPLRLTFPRTARLGTAGWIRIFDAGNHALIEAIDISRPTATKAIGGLTGFHYHPVIVAAREATLFPARMLGYGRSYYVIIDDSVFPGERAGVGRPTDWRFTTKPAPPAAGSTRLVVADDGTGDFCTVQGAIDFIPIGNTAPTTIFVRPGLYTEIVCLRGKNALTILGQDRRNTVIAYANNARFNGGGGNPYAGSGAAAPRSRQSGYRRGVFSAYRADDLTLANLTIRNLTPARGSQAEAIILGDNRTPIARAILRNLNLDSHQDTLQINGQAYVEDCRIEGDVDFMWGTGPCYFENCECEALRSGAYYAQIRNPGTNHGYIYHRCTFDGAPGITGNYLARIEPRRFPHSEVVLLDCVLTRAAGRPGWLLQGPGAASSLHFWEYRSHRPDGRPVDTSRRLAVSRQLRLPADTATIADYRDPAWVLEGWDPTRASPAARGAAPQ